jgi:FAD/FMN-containing dehydrogenase
VRTSDVPAGEPIVELAPWAASLERWIFRGSQGSEYGKELRWGLEANIAPWFFARTTHRNQVMQSRVQLYENRDPARTDVLHEYFVPRERLEEFLRRARAILSAERPDLLNVTMRDVRRDGDTLLRYADADMMALVFFFSQARTPDADAAMQALTRELIEASLRWTLLPPVSIARHARAVRAGLPDAGGVLRPQAHGRSRRGIPEPVLPHVRRSALDERTLIQSSNLSVAKRSRLWKSPSIGGE